MARWNFDKTTLTDPATVRVVRFSTGSLGSAVSHDSDERYRERKRIAKAAERKRNALRKTQGC